MLNKNHERFKNLTFDKFRELAGDNSLTQYEKIGFPNSYREGYEGKIFSDINSKLTKLDSVGATVLDIGPGCSGLAHLLIQQCRERNQKLILIDSEEVLNQLPNETFITKVAGRYPQETENLFKEYTDKIDVVLTYSVLHYIYCEANLFDFIDKSLNLLAEGGQFLIGDIPNISKRKRFFSSANGVVYHQQFTGTKTLPDVFFNTIEDGQIDDAVLMSILLRSRSAGFDAYIMPQNADLPMANRREDILITRP